MTIAVSFSPIPHWALRIKQVLAAAVQYFASEEVPAETEADVNMRAEKLFDKYANSILRLAYSYLHSLPDAEDILQETLIRFLRSRSVFSDEVHEKAWLLHVAANLSKNRIQYNRIRHADELDEELVAEEHEDLSFGCGTVECSGI